MGSVIYKGKGIANIQDMGRIGYRQYGVPISGYLDRQSAWKANWLAGNPLDSALFEFFYSDFQLKFLFDCTIGICGAADEVILNDHIFTVEESIQIKKGDHLKIGALKNGLITYVAVSGNFSLKQQLNSFSTYTPSRLGGFKGRILKEGDKIDFHHTEVRKRRVLPDEWKHFFPKNCTLRYMEGPEYHLLEDFSKNVMNQSSFKISRHSNRMGYRTEGVVLKSSIDFEMPSLPVVPGTLQLPKSGFPIILMNDGQTTGGYLRIGTIISPDLGDLAQTRPGARIRFKKVTLSEANTIYRVWYNKFHH